MATDKAAGNGAEPATPPRIVLTFGGPDSATVGLIAEPGISPGQVYLAAWYLEAVAREMRQGQVVQNALAGGAGPVDPTLAGIAARIMAGHKS